MKSVQLWRCVLRCLKLWLKNIGEERNIGHCKMVYNFRNRKMQGNVLCWQHARRIRGDHGLATVVGLVGRIARHRAAALHCLLVGGYRRYTVGKLQRKERRQSRHQECHSMSHLFKLYAD